MTYSFASIIQDAEKARWRIEDVISCIHDIDFSRDFLPDALAKADALEFLDPVARQRVNHIRAHSYVQLFALVERFILPFAMTQAGAALHESAEELLALMQFGEEEAKHIALFERFAQAFEFGFGTPCEFIGPAAEIVGSVMTEDPLGVALATLHIEWMTQQHYLHSVRGDPDIDPRYKSLLRHHWIEEAQHARLDVLLIERLAGRESAHGCRRATDAYIRIFDQLAALLDQQVELDLDAFTRAHGSLTDAERDRWRAVQRPAYRDAFVLAGVNHPRFRAVQQRCFPGCSSKIEAASARWAAG
ncbi:MAG: hypothetical protein H6713_20360 [Myxococcales bacterium]|nr:hypothetical protein [Myxococcales bacterium]